MIKYLIIETTKDKLSPSRYTLFDASIAENIAFGIPKKEIDFKLIDEVLQLVGILKYVKSLEDGLNTSWRKRK